MKKNREITDEEKKFFESSKTLVDKLTVQVQLDRVQEKAMKILEKRCGNIIPKQTPDQLKEVLIEAVNELSK